MSGLYIPAHCVIVSSVEVEYCSFCEAFPA